MENLVLLSLIASSVISAIVAFSVTFATKWFVDASIRKKVQVLQSDVEGIDLKVTRRNQRDNNAKAQAKLEETSSIEQEALQRVQNRVESTPSRQMKIPGLHQGFYKE